MPFSHPPQPKVLADGWVLVGILDAIQPVGDGLVQLRIAGREMLVSDELEGKLTSLVAISCSSCGLMTVGDARRCRNEAPAPTFFGRKISILRRCR